MEEIKWYDVPKGAKCLLNSEEWEKDFECLWIDGRYLRWKDGKWTIYIWNLSTYLIDEPYNWRVYEKNNLNLK